MTIKASKIGLAWCKALKFQRHLALYYMVCLTYFSGYVGFKFSTQFLCLEQSRLSLSYSSQEFCLHDEESLEPTHRSNSKTFQQNVSQQTRHLTYMQFLKLHKTINQKYIHTMSKMTHSRKSLCIVKCHSENKNAILRPKKFDSFFGVKSHCAKIMYSTSSTSHQNATCLQSYKIMSQRLLETDFPSTNPQVKRSLSREYR